jgi:fatty acid desaturase
VESEDYSAMAATRERPQRRLAALLAATALCYAIGYPLALIGHSAVGWVFVALGGPLLIALGVVVIRRVHFSAEARDRRTDLDAT